MNNIVELKDTLRECLSFCPDDYRGPVSLHSKPDGASLFIVWNGAYFPTMNLRRGVCGWIRSYDLSNNIWNLIGLYDEKTGLVKWTDSQGYVYGSVDAFHNMVFGKGRLSCKRKVS